MPADAPLEVTVAVAPALHTHCTEALGPRVEVMLAAALDDLDVAARPVVDVVERDVPFVRMEVGGRACLYPDSVIPECAAYVRGYAAVTPVDDALALDARLADA